MSEIQTVGMVMYTYAILEEYLDDLWNWLRDVESWSGQPCVEFHFASRAKESSRVWKATAENRTKLYHRLRTEQPWLGIDFGYPAGTLKQGSFATKGIYVSVVSREQPVRGMERYRIPSYIYIEVHPQVLSESVTGVSGLLDLGEQIWRISEGVYGFIDLQMNIPLQDNILRNAAHLFDSTVPPKYHDEFRKWQELMPLLDRRTWKAFWGNFLGAEHLRRLGGIEDMRRADPRYRLLPEYLEQAYQKGVDRLRACDCWERWQALSDGGVLLTLSPSPLDWFAPQVQDRRKRLQAALGAVALHVDPDAST